MSLNDYLGEEEPGRPLSKGYTTILIFWALFVMTTLAPAAPDWVGVTYAACFGIELLHDLTVGVRPTHSGFTALFFVVPKTFRPSAPPPPASSSPA